MKNFKTKIKILISILVFFFGIQAIYATWTGPTDDFPLGNTSAPLNVSPLGQSKIGGLILNTVGAGSGLLVFGTTTDPVLGVCPIGSVWKDYNENTIIDNQECQIETLYVSNDGMSVTGTTTFNGPIKVGGSIGTAGQVLQSGGPGNAPTWGSGGGAINATEYCDENGLNCFTAASTSEMIDGGGGGGGGLTYLGSAVCNDTCTVPVGTTFAVVRVDFRPLTFLWGNNSRGTITLYKEGSALAYVDVNMYPTTGVSGGVQIRGSWSGDTITLSGIPPVEEKNNTAYFYRSFADSSGGLSVLNGTTEIGAQALADRSVDDTDFTKVKEFQIDAPGTYTVRCEYGMGFAPAGGSATVQFRKNDVTFYTSPAESGIWDTVSASVSVDKNDHIQIYSKKNNIAHDPARVRNAELLYGQLFLNTVIQN